MRCDLSASSHTPLGLGGASSHPVDGKAGGHSELHLMQTTWSAILTPERLVLKQATED